MLEQIDGAYRFGRVLAVRYGDEFGNWDPSAAVRIANFVLGHDVETNSNVLNERMMDVVQPIEEFWNPPLSADLEIIDLGLGGARLGIGLGQWLVRYPTRMLR